MPGACRDGNALGFMREEAQERGMTSDELKEEELDTIPLHRCGYGKGLCRGNYVAGVGIGLRV